MNKNIYIIFCLVFLFCSSSYGQYDSFCGVDHFYKGTNLNVDSFLDKTNHDLRLGEVLYVRTVVHVVYNTPDQNISDSEIELLIENVNKLFRAEDIDTTVIHPEHRSKISNTEIQFCLATTDPVGQSTNGITRTETSHEQFQIGDDPEYIKQDSLGKTPWDIDFYLNIWIAPMGTNSSNSNYAHCRPTQLPLGAFFADSVVPGVVLDVDNLLNGNPFGGPQYILAHESGHAFGMLHTTGLLSPDMCAEDDLIDDTPNCSFGGMCGPPFNTNTCIDEIDDEPDNASNLMNYSCLKMFTPGQTEQMRENILINGPTTILTDSDCEGIYLETFELKNEKQKFIISPNPNNGNFYVNFSKDITLGSTLLLYNPIGQQVFVKEINQANTTNVAIDVSGFNGVYFLVIITQSELLKEKIVISN